MTPAPEKLAALRHLLAERFPPATRSGGRVLPTEIPALDAVGGGLPLGAVTELVCTRASSGGHLVLAQLLARTRALRLRVALVDATDCFDPGSLPPDHLAHLVWIRCHAVTPAVQATDLLARDANLGLVCLDLRASSAAELRRIPGTQWYRIQRAAEPADLALVVLTARPCVPSAEVRFVLDRSHELAAASVERPALINQLHATLDRQRRSIASTG